MNESEKYEEKLNGLDKDSFSVPDGYFESLPEKIIERIDLMDAKKIAAENPFSTPEGYFEKLSSDITNRIAVKTVNRPIFKRAVILVPLACLLIMFGYFLLNKNSSTEKTEIATDGLENSSFLQSIDESILLDELIASETVQQDDTLTDYILKNNIDLSDLENAL
jgi:hypothetical protein